MKPYIGITGFMRRDEVDSVFPPGSGVPTHDFMVGVLASSKTLRGETNKWPGRYPPVGNISDIFSDREDVLNLIHYSTDDVGNLFDQLGHLAYCGGPNLHGFQLNVSWPDPGVIDAYRSWNRRHRIVLQIGRRALEDVNNKSAELAERLHPYLFAIDAVLIDPSGGLGKPLIPARARSYLNRIRTKQAWVGIGVAGGLSPTTLHLVESLFGDFPALSIDAEGRLRDADDNLDIELAREYAAKAVRMLRARR